MISIFLNKDKGSKFKYVIFKDDQCIGYLSVASCGPAFVPANNMDAYYSIYSQAVEGDMQGERMKCIVDYLSMVDLDPGVKFHINFVDVADFTWDRLDKLSKSIKENYSEKNS